MNLPCDRLLDILERKESSRIERKQRLEYERRKKILDEKHRMIGIDREALEGQVREKSEMMAEQKKKDELYAKQMSQMLEDANRMETELREARKRQLADLMTYRQIYQLKKHSRDFDLNDPDAMKKECNPSYDCNTLACVLSGRTYQEEKEERMRFQKVREQQKAWLEEQIQEKREWERQKQEAQKCYEHTLLQREKRAKELAMMEEQFKRKLEQATREYNQCLANEQANAKRLNKLKEMEDEKAEVHNAITGDFLTENPALTFCSPLGPHKMIVTHFKGMTPQMKQDILDTQRKQLEELQERRRQEKELERKWDNLMMEVGRLAHQEDTQLMKKKLELTKQLLEENDALAKQQRCQQERLRHLFENQVREEFFEQFEKSSR